MFGLHTFIQSMVRPQRFWNYGHEEMRGDSPQHASLRLTYFISNTFYWKKTKTKKKNISMNARKMSMNDPSDRIYFGALAHSLYTRNCLDPQDTEAWKYYYNLRFKQTSTRLPAQDHYWCTHFRKKCKGRNMKIFHTRNDKQYIRTRNGKQNYLHIILGGGVAV